MSDWSDLERDIAEEGETRDLLRGGDQDLVAPAFAAIQQHAAHRRPFSSAGALAVAALVLAVVVGIAGWRGSLQVAAPSLAPGPTATTLAYPGSPCQSVTVRQQRFEDSVPATRANPTPAAFTGDHFSGIGRVVSIAQDGSSVFLELVNPLLFDAYGATTVKITPQTSFDHTETQWAFVGAPGVAAGATQFPLAPGAPGVGAGQQILIQCMIDNHGTGAGGVTVRSAAPGEAAWTLTQPLTLGFPPGALVSYDRIIHVVRFADLGVAVGQSVQVEFSGTPGNYSATKLTNVIPIYGMPAPTAAPSASLQTGPKLRWSQPAAIPAAAILQMVKWHDSYVGAADAVINNQHVAAIVVSHDGVHWEQVASLTTPLQVFAGAPVLVATSTRLLAFVHRESQLATTDAWASTSGVTWDRADALGLSRATVNRAVAHDDVLLAMGTDASGTTRLWRSTDGSGWNVVSLPTARAVIYKLIAAKDGFLVVGREGDPDRSSGGVGAPGIGTPAAWWSADGVTWTAARVEGAAAPGAQLIDVFPVANGYLAVGSDTTNTSTGNPRSPLFWTSTDGRDWKHLGAPAHWGRASSDGQRLLVFGYADAQTGALGAWYTPDGKTWTAATMGGDQVDIPAYIQSPSHNSRVDDMLALPEGVVVIGQRNGDPMSWFAASE